MLRPSILRCQSSGITTWYFEIGLDAQDKRLVLIMPVAKEDALPDEWALLGQLSEGRADPEVTDSDCISLALGTLHLSSGRIRFRYCNGDYAKGVLSDDELAKKGIRVARR